jgi:hypothetical protein
VLLGGKRLLSVMGVANLMVLFAVFFRHLLALVAEILLHGRIDD